MPGEVVGTAFVRIKALVDNLGKDIKREVEKGMKDADLGKIGGDAGDELGENLGKNTVDSAKKTIKKRSRGLFQDVADQARETAQRSRELFDVWGDLPFDDGRSSMDRFFDRLKLRVNSVDNSLRDFFTRTSAGFRNMLNKDGDGFEKSLVRIGKKLKDFGDNAFSSIGKLPLVLGGIGAAIVGALPYIQDIGATILAYATGLVAQIGFLATALGGLGVAAGAALATVATTALPIVLAFKSETEALVEFKDVLKASGEEFLRIGTATQATLLPALTEALTIIEDLVVPLSEFGLFVGRAVGDFALLAANTLTGTEALGRFRDIMQSALRILDIILPAALDVGGILSGIWVAALPAAERFATIIAGLAARWRGMIDEGLRTGALVDTFDLWFDRAVVLGRAIGNVAGALFDILQIGADSSDNVFNRFDDWARRYRDFTESEVGQNRIKLIFDNALEVMREVNGIAADLFDGIFGRLGRIGGVDAIVDQLRDFREILPEIQEAWAGLYDDIKRVVEFLLDNFQGKLEKAIEELAEPLGRLGDQILRLLETMDESGAFEIFLDLLRIMTDILSTLLAIPGFGTFIGYMLAFGSAIKVAKIALGPFISVLGSFVTQIGLLVTATKGKALADSAGALSRFIAGFRGISIVPAAAGAAGQAAAGLGANAGGMAAQVGAGAAALGGLALPLGIAAGALAIGGIAFFNHQQKVQAWRQEIRQAEDALGTFNGGLLITADGIEKYITEFSRFDSRNQEDDLRRIGTSVGELAERILEGTISYQEFGQAALDAGEISFKTIDQFGNRFSIDPAIDSFAELGEEFQLSSEQLDELIAKGRVFEDGVQIIIDGNADLLVSFDELNRVIGEGIQENIGEFVSDSLTVELLGPDFLDDLLRQIEDATPEEAIQLQQEAYDRLGAQARLAAEDIVGVSDETRRQIAEQVSTIGNANERDIAALELLRAESARVSQEILNDFELFRSDNFQAEFGEARQAVIDFSNVVMSSDLTAFDDWETFLGGPEELARVFPELGTAAQNLFTQLQGLPEAEFEAAARAMGADADDLRGAMESAMQSIQELQDQAVSSLPTIGSLLDEATEVREDGSQFFDPDAFLTAARERITETRDFGTNIAQIQDRFGDEAARLAVQQGPEAAANLASMVGAGDEQVAQVLADMEAAEIALRDQISLELGPGIALEAATAANLIGTDFTIGLAAGLQDPAAAAAIQASADTVEQQFARNFQVRLVFDEEKLVYTLVPVRRTSAGGQHHIQFSEGGYVGAGPTFNTGPTGTDTVNAWLTPGEFVLRRAIAQAIPANVLNSLNAGDPRMIGLLNSLNRTRPAGVDAVVATVTAATPAQVAGSGFTIQQMNIEAPSPLESARQVADRLRIMQSQLSRR